MKVLLDQNLDRRLRKHLGSHEVFTASYKGWQALKNGQLLDVAEREGFDVLVTGDQTLSYEQNLTGRRLAIVALSSVEWRIVRVYLQRIVAAVDGALPGSFQAVVSASAVPSSPGVVLKNEPEARSSPPFSGCPRISDSEGPPRRSSGLRFIPRRAEGPNAARTDPAHGQRVGLLSHPLYRRQLPCTHISRLSNRDLPFPRNARRCRAAH